MIHSIMRLTRAFIVIGLLVACGPTGTAAVPTDTGIPPTSTLVPTNTSVPTATPRPTSTLRPTATNRPTDTPPPTIAVPSGFTPIEGNGITLWLPESFDGGSMTGKDREVLLEAMSSLGGDFARTAKQFEATANNMLFLAFDSRVNQQGGVTTVIVVEIPVISSMKPVTLAEMLAAQLPTQFKGIKVSEVEAVELPHYPAARFTAQLNLNDASIKEILYVVNTDDATYLVTFAAALDEFEELLPVFEQSIQTFTVEP